MMSEIADIVGGLCAGPDVPVSGAAVDSRTVSGGELFVPLRAARDGHDWIGSALAAGAAGYLTERPPAGGSAVRVESARTALAMLASHARTCMQSAVLGITGSVGKTTAKDMISAILAEKFVTYASKRSFNNEIGLPITLMCAPANVEALVLEMGANAPGEIARLCEIARPTIGIVTRVAPVHTAGFGDVAGVAKAKGELIQALPATGTAILNGDDERVAAMARLTDAKVLLFGSEGEVRGAVLEMDENLHPTIGISTPSGSVEVRISARGAHQVTNATAAAAAAYVCGASPDQIAYGLETAELSPHRMHIMTNAKGVRIIDDSYNASPVATEAALRSLAFIEADRRIAVLGQMAELGSAEAPEHCRIAQLAEELGIVLMAVDAPQYGVECLAPDEVAHRLASLSGGDAVLVKGSRIAGLELIVDTLTSGEARP